MADWNGLGNLDLRKVESSSNYVRLPKGEHHVKITDAIMKDSSSGGKYLQVNFKGVTEVGDINSNFNLVNSNPQAVDIGKRQLKSLLLAAKHPNPDKPKDVASLKNLELNIVVGNGKPFTGDDGKTREQTEVKVYKELADGKAPSGGGELDDEIPF